MRAKEISWVTLWPTPIESYCFEKMFYCFFGGQEEKSHKYFICLIPKFVGSNFIEYIMGVLHVKIASREVCLVSLMMKNTRLKEMGK